LKAADLAAQEGVRIYTIGVGADEQTEPGPFGMLQTVPSDLDEGALKTIARKTGGRYFRASDVTSLAGIYDELDKIEPLSKDGQSWRPVEELYTWPLGAALILTVLCAVSTIGFRPRARSADKAPSGARHV
jgi:Ca-activated chloride channel family protein